MSTNGQELERKKHIEVFCCYARKDQSLLFELKAHLTPLEQEGFIKLWADIYIDAGTEWEKEIHRRLDAANIILLLVSPDFLISNYCYSIEMMQAIQKHSRGEAEVIPIILRYIDWQSAPFGKLQALPTNAVPITSTMWSSRDEAFFNVAKGIREVVLRHFEKTPMKNVEKEKRTFSLSQQISLPEAKSPLRTNARFPEIFAIDSQKSRPEGIWLLSILHTKLSEISSSTRHKNRTALIKRVHSFWVSGVLEKSISEAKYIQLEFNGHPNAVANPWKNLVQETNQLSYQLPAGTRAIDIYDSNSGNFLILGDPGAGKTFLLLDLARDLLNRAYNDETLPVPVIFNLSSWAEYQPPFIAWLVEELYIKYQVPRQVGSAWIQANELVLLLDGLDEVPQMQRALCIETINSFFQENNFPSLIVCSRKEEYIHTNKLLILQQAIDIKPLTIAQIKLYFANSGGQSEIFEQALNDDPSLLEISKTPLMLGVLSSVYQGESSQVQHSFLSQRQQIFTKYVHHMFSRRSSSKSYSEKQTLHWLSWLAKQMKQRNLSEFYLEQLQLDWVSDKYRYQFALLFIIGLVLAFVAGFIDTLFFLRHMKMMESIVGGVIMIFTHLLTYIIFNSLISADSRRPTIWLLQRNTLSQKTKRFEMKQIFKSTPVYALLSGLVIGSVYSIFLGYELGINIGLIYAPYGIFSNGLLIGLVGPFVVTIQPIEIVTWTWKNMRRNFNKSLYIALFFGMVIGILFVRDHGFKYGTLLGLIFFLLALGMLILTIGGISYDTLEERTFFMPNHGIWRSVKNSIFWGGLSASLSFLLFGITDSISEGLMGGLSFGFIAGLSIGCVVALRGGGIACIKHLLVRILLWQAGYTPWRYSQLLDYASERILLRKVGGGYIYIHRLLLEYLAMSD